MDWDCEQTIQGSVRTILPCSFTSTVIAIDITADNQQPTWYRSGFLRAILDIDGQPFIGTDIETIFGQQVITLPFSNYRIDFTPRVWLDLTTIKVAQLTTTQINSIAMGINLAPQPRERIGSEQVQIVPVGSGSIEMLENDDSRRTGFVVNNANTDLWISFSTGDAVIGSPSNLVTPGSNIEIPDNYTGQIFGIWTPGFTYGSAEIHYFQAV